MAGKFTNLPFTEAIKFFKGKLRIPTMHWDDLWKGMHSRGFMVAGAMKDDLLSDFQESLTKAMTEGMTLSDFKKDFDNIVSKHGWTYKGSRGWRSRIIFETNVRTSYSAGRYNQMTDPEVLEARPFWKYVHGDSINPRKLHLSWDGKVLPADDPWWDTHYTPNGWGCRCKVVSCSKRDLKSMGKDYPDQAHVVPKGIDPGWDYNPGKEALKQGDI
jgi:uncharacterized protein with gpF-like domain